MPKVKICGTTNLPDALLACELGADALGFIFYKKSQRRVSPEQARDIIRDLPPFVTKVGVFVNRPADEINRIAEVAGLDAVQLHGEEPPGLCRQVRRPLLKVFRVGKNFEAAVLRPYRAAAFLLDTWHPQSFGGTGEPFDWRLALPAKAFGRIILAGGLDPENVTRALELVQPYGIDLCSGVERRPGRKDPGKMRALFAILNRERSLTGLEIQSGS